MAFIVRSRSGPCGFRLPVSCRSPGTAPPSLCAQKFSVCLRLLPAVAGGVARSHRTAASQACQGLSFGGQSQHAGSDGAVQPHDLTHVLPAPDEKAAHLTAEGLRGRGRSAAPYLPCRGATGCAPAPGRALAAASALNTAQRCRPRSKPDGRAGGRMECRLTSEPAHDAASAHRVSEPIRAKRPTPGGVGP